MTTRGPRFWLLWSWRDLRRRLSLVLAIGLLLAGGTGLAAGLGSMRDWRVDSNDASFAALSTHDLRVQVEEGSFVEQGSLAGPALAIPEGGAIAAASERLILPTQIDAAGAGAGDVITPGRMVGVESGEARTVDGVELTGPPVDAIALSAGEGLPASAGGGTQGAGGSGSTAAAILEARYAELNGIEPPARIELAGGAAVEVVGTGSSPETFVVLGPTGQFGSERSFGVVFAGLETAQRLSGREGRVNDLVVTVEPGADRAALGEQLGRAIAAANQGVGVTVTTTEEIDGYSILYDDAENDQQLFDVFAFLILAGAGLAAFNLISRTIESQRREIGIGMALGAPPRLLAIRPLLLGLQVATIGLVLGAAVGLAINEWLRSLLADLLPLPILETEFRPGTFAQRAAIGFAIPLLAAAWPVRRGLAMTPIDAIQTGHRASRGGGFAPLVAKLPLPGGTIAQMPARNVLRSPRRTFLTVLAAGAVIAVAVSMSGVMDSFRATVDRSAAEELRTAPDRLNVTLDGFQPVGEGAAAAIAGSPAVARVEPALRIPAALSSGAGERIDVIARTLAVAGAEPLWAPRASTGRLPEGAGEILISESAADDLGVEVGEEVVLTHPRRAGPDRFETATTPVRVSGTHPDPFRFAAFIDAAAATVFGLEGSANSVDVLASPGTSPGEATRALLGIPGVASIEPASALSESLEEALDEFTAVVGVVIAIAIALVLLIAFNSTAINADERAREHATMLAYGLRPRTVLRVSILESLIMGLIATAIGVGLGLLILAWVINVSAAEVLPELGIVTALSFESLLIAGLAGVGAMALAPLLTLTRLRRMDIPSTLRVVE